ncbi:hypothetical protein M422DRAFT_49214 [Sphaerobolus stellatus SS14]|uniref:Uncharacterized protein n=1 Tax=Sphaerobolus stellatus (strain SS14) TaxID=990650 RepID=A0A0C9UZH7_SPHS4|nr:hypothetical protein M422DRAFT_49214 [Sphaerobolus stellatus SS14]
MSKRGYPEIDIPREYGEYNSEAEAVVASWVSEKIGWDVAFRNAWGCKPSGLMIEMYNNYSPKAKYALSEVVGALKVILKTEAEAQWYLDSFKADWDWNQEDQ